MRSKAKKPASAAPPKDAAFAKTQAGLMTHASVNAAAIIEKFGAAGFGEPGIDLIVESVADKVGKVQEGSLRSCEAMLMGQALALQSMFMSLSRRAAAQDYLNQYETYLRLALKAQSQCRATLETLAAIKNPPVVFARQANIANGPQQVNNGVAPPPATHAEEMRTSPNKLLEANYEQPMDTGPASTTGGSDSDLEAVAQIDRPKDNRG